VARKPPIVLLPAGLLAAGIAAMAVAVARGDAELRFVLVFPVLSGTGAVFAVGAGLLILGMLVAFVGLPLLTLSQAGGAPVSPPARPPSVRRGPRPQAPGTDADRQWGGVVFIGPIPIVFGSSPRMGKWMLVLAAVVTVLLLVLFLGALML
jgi:uncharacterized protein (TIGR00304 family)